ncbi:MAG: hypothetical protein MPN21_11875 [Thermoanaerobaculia bacterium]|nr:hypothetical protein [Thermoanaerobaculia bacterium]
MVLVLEELTVFTPLGIRFWDPVLDGQVRDSLKVEAWPVPGLRPVARAQRTGSDIYAFHGLPGLLAVEYQLPEASQPSPPAPRPFVVRVIDTARRFLPVAFRVELPLPYRGVFLGASASSPIESSPSGFLLFSSATRVRPPWLGAVRGELVDRVSGEPVANALVRVDVDGEPSRYGLADETGRFAVFLPYPPPVDMLSGSPPGGTPPLGDRTFPITLTVHSVGGGLSPLPGADLPDYGELLRQLPASVWPVAPDDGGVAEPQWHGDLRWGRELVVRTAGDSRLLITPAASPP